MPAEAKLWPNRNGSSMFRSSTREPFVRHRSLLAIVVLTMLPLLMISVARAQDRSKYPDWKGQWNLIIHPGMNGQVVKFDPTKPWGRGQEAPLTPEYQKVHE